MLCQVTRKDEPYSGLYLSRCHGLVLVVSREPSRLCSETFQEVRGERVYDSHSLVRDTSLRVYLLKHLVDVGRVRGEVTFLLSLLLFGGFTTPRRHR